MCIRDRCSTSCKGLCKKCATLNCYRICPDYSIKACSTLARYPHICNGCTKKISCHSEKYHYRAMVAEANYRELLISSREGLNVTATEMDTLDKWLSPLIKQGQISAPASSTAIRWLLTKSPMWRRTTSTVLLVSVSID